MAPRGILTQDEAREIFLARLQNGKSGSNSFSTRLAEHYNISPKAIRDIWTGRSWLEATFDLWNAEDRPCRRSVGRPKGKKDSKPRKSKKTTRSESNTQLTSYQNAGMTASFETTHPLLSGEKMESKKQPGNILATGQNIPDNIFSSALPSFLTVRNLTGSFSSTLSPISSPSSIRAFAYTSLPFDLCTARMFSHLPWFPGPGFPSPSMAEGLLALNAYSRF